MGAIKDRAGQRFGRLTALRLASKRANDRHNFWVCRCDCGSEIELRGSSLNGNTQSCGCLWVEKTAEALQTHGLTGTPEYKIWTGMKNRCYNVNSDRYPFYGGRGIKVCDRWLNSFENFLSDMGNRPSKLTIERVDNNGNYEPSNCKWGTKLEQVRNRRCTLRLEYKGENLTVHEWASKTGLKPQTISFRIHAGWSPKDVIEKPHRLGIKYEY